MSFRKENLMAFNAKIDSKWSYRQEGYDLDNYDISYYSGLSTKECSIQLRFGGKMDYISATAIKYGEWGGISEEEKIDIINFLRDKGELMREPTESMLKKICP